ncbi:MAG: MerR family transcriptional regulator [Actinobacteria bacterium]|nr:MerR family transcriptional regulator [Actinomycetota bacterium]
MYSIGEFSRISGLSIKALRLYHEKELLIPTLIDDQSGYRYYDHKNVERARIIKYLRDMEFSLSDIGEILKDANDEADVVEFFEKKKKEILSRIHQQKNIIKNLELIIKTEKEAVMALNHTEFEVEEKEFDTLLIAGVRYKGKYSDCGEAFKKISKAMGWNICGKPFNLYYDSEYKEEDADIETCMPVKKGKNVEGISVRELPGGKGVSLIHKGPYEALGRSYEKIMAYIKGKGYRPKLPTREVYLKGPGMIFKGNPENYLTEFLVVGIQ